MYMSQLPDTHCKIGVVVAENGPSKTKEYFSILPLGTCSHRSASISRESATPPPKSSNDSQDFHGCLLALVIQQRKSFASSSFYENIIVKYYIIAYDAQENLGHVCRLHQSSLHLIRTVYYEMRSAHLADS